jgi:hypothetical protein
MLDESHRIIDGRRVPIAKFIMDKQTNRQRLDAPYGYRKNIDFGTGIQDSCIIHVSMDISSTIERYATVSHPDSDNLVAFRCRLLYR